MRQRLLSAAMCLLCTGSILTAQTTDDSSERIIKHTSREDSLFYASLSDTIFPSRSGVTGDAMDNPIQVGPFTNSFNFTDTRNTSSSYTHQYGRNTADVYYCLVLTAPMNVTFTHDGSGVEDTKMYLLDSAGNLIEENDDYDGDGRCSSMYNSYINRQLAAGTYYVVSEGYYIDGPITTNITGNTSSGYGYPVIPSAYSTEPHSVGGMGGQFSVSPMGGATYSIPIEVPLGVNGMQPGIAITYNSQAGNGLCGYGANITGLSSITRGPKNIYHDGAAYGMQYYGDDAFYLDGVRLILYSGTAGQDGAIYYPESDPYTKVLQHGTCYTGTNYMWFEVTNKAGVTCWYGYSTGRHKYYVSGNEKTLSWNLMYMVDPFGNELAIDYETVNNVIYPTTIRYGMNNRSYNPLQNYVYFKYATRPDVITTRFDYGNSGVMDLRLDSIITKTGSAVYRKYKLNYNDTGDGTACKFSRLVSVVEKNAQEESLPATLFEWSYLPAVSYTANSLSVNDPDNLPAGSSFQFEDQKFISGDLNGDAIPEIVGFGTLGNNTVAEIYYGSLDENGSIEYNTSGNYYNLPMNESYLHVMDTYMKEQSIADIDGDGINELVVPYYDGVENDYGRMYFYIIGENFNNEWCGFEMIRPDPPLCCTADLNNDGKNSVAVLETDDYMYGYTFHLYKYNEQHSSSNHNVLINDTIIYLSFGSKPRRMYMTDMNNNGLTDMLVICENGYKVFWNQGGTALFIDQNQSSISGTNLKDYGLTTPGDFNGDGLLDVLTKGIMNTLNIYLNNGNGTFSSFGAYNNINMEDISDYNHCDVFDFDEDGKTDVVITVTVPSGVDIWPVNTYWMRSNGSTLNLVSFASSNRYNDALSNKYLTGDFDGDGFVELVNYGYDCAHGSNSNSDPVWRIYKNSNLTAQSGKVTKITGDFGATTNITYSTLTDPDVYTRGTNTPYPAPKYTLPINVVKTVVQNNGAAGSMTTDYAYSDLRIHLQGKGMLGFCSTEASNITLGTTVTSTVTAWNNTFYIPSSTQTLTTIGNSYSRQTTTLTILDKGQKKYFAYPSQTVDRDFDTNTVTTTRSIVDSIGLPATETVQYAQNMYRTVEYSDYIMAGRRYQPRTLVSRQRHPDDSSEFSNTIRNNYDSTTGALTQSIDGFGKNKPLTTDYTYTTYGHVFSKQLSGDGIGYYIQYYGYDNTKRFLTKEYSSPEAYVMEYTYDTWGNMLTETDNSNTSYPVTVTHTYDGWGNLIRTQMPDGGEITYTRGWNNFTYKRYFILTQGTGRPWVKTWYDNQGREVLTQTIGPKDVTIAKATLYDSNGLADIISQSTGNFSESQYYGYDARGRITSESRSTSNGTISYTYSSDGLTTTVNDNGRQTTYTYDVMGNVKQVDDPVSGQVKHKYSSGGGIRETQVNGAVWTIGYDDRGNRASLTDPDAGTTTYEYDALGRERKRTDARGVVFVTYYNYLGNVTYINASKNSDSETIYYTYGTSGTGKLRLVGKTLGNWTESYEYDQYGRMTMENRGGHTSTFEYSQTGLVSRMTWVSGNDNSNYVDYTYDTYGNCIGKSAMSGAVQWNLTGNTGTVTTSTMRLHSNTSPFTRTTTLDYNGNLSSVTLTRSNNSVSSASYSFNSATGNLTSRTLGGTTQSFTYDNADRLTSVQQGNQTLLAMTYAGNGNIMSKTGIGDYEYSSAKPHAVEAVDNTSGLIPEGTQSVTYNLWGKVSEVNAVVGSDTYRYELTYGPDLQRVLAVLWKNNSLVHLVTYGRDYEEKYVGSDITRYYYINGTDGNAAVYTSNSSGGKAYCMDMDHLGSITGLYDQYGTKCYGASFDPWGKRTLMSGSIEFDRGFTGHEHIDEINLIDMNGRMYDPLLGRFLSSDPFVQAPTNPQNFNRYSYCLNNPLRYTDPSGEKISWLWGLAVGLGLVPIEAAMAFVTVATSDAITSGLFGFFDGLYHGGWNDGCDQAVKRATNSIKIATGMIQSDELDGNGKNCKELIQFGRSYFRSVWCSPISLLGYAYACNANMFDRVEVDDFYGATVVRTNWSASGVTLGHYIMIDSDIINENEFKSLLIHEYGHFMQSRDWGGFSALSGGIFSLASALEIIPRIGNSHEDMWVERDASARGADHLNILFDNKIDLKNYYESQYPQEYYKLRMLHNLFIPFSVGFGIYNIINPN